MKTPAVLVLSCMTSICALGQASNMISVSALQQESEVATAYTRSNIKCLMNSAKTPEEIERLAMYFDRQAEEYAAKYQAEQKELDRLLALRYHARSYPAQVESTRNRIDHFRGLSHKYSEQSKLYRTRAKGDGATGARSSPPPE